MGLIYSVSVLFFTFMIFRMYLKKDIRPYMTSRVVTLLTILGLLPYVNTVIIIATLGDAVVKFNEYRNLTKQDLASEFKRKKAPIYISRELYE